LLSYTLVPALLREPSLLQGLGGRLRMSRAWRHCSRLGIRPPLGIEVEVRGKDILATRME